MPKEKFVDESAVIQSYIDTREDNINFSETCYKVEKQFHIGHSRLLKILRYNYEDIPEDFRDHAIEAGYRKDCFDPHSMDSIMVELNAEQLRMNLGYDIINLDCKTMRMAVGAI